MKIKEFLKGTKENAPEIFAIFEKQQGEALDIKNVSKLLIKQDNKANTFNVSFEKKKKSYSILFNGVSKLLIEQIKVNQTQADLCIRNGINNLNFVAVCNDAIISFNFISAAITEAKSNTTITF